jgi:glutamine synthetase
MNAGPTGFSMKSIPLRQSGVHLISKVTIKAIASLWEEDHEYLTKGGVFPQILLDTWIRNKRKEADTVNKIPYPAEMRLYYDL